MDSYKLDPANYRTAPGLAWDAMLKMTSIELDLISDVDMLSMIERQTRGELCSVVPNRHVKANNTCLADYSPSQASIYVMYLDANKLYGFELSQNVPYNNLKFESHTTLKQLLKASDTQFK